MRSKVWFLAVVLVVLALGGIWQYDASPRVNAQDDDEKVQAILENYTFQAVDDILESPLDVSNFAADGSATLPIKTSVPVACSVVYGTTEAFGQLAVDQDMAGGTHADHNPLLLDLLPNTDYYFRVQGVDDAGIVYVSEVMTFTTPDFEAMAQDNKNLASPENGATVTGFSSAFGAAGLEDRWGAGSAFDNNTNTQWSSDGDGDSAWIEVELQHKAYIESVEFWTRAMNDGSATTLEFTITNEYGEVFGPFEVPDASQPYEFEVIIEAQTLRFDLITTTGGNSGVVNIAVYGYFIDA